MWNPPKPLIALVGRPNVGKSALINRIVGRRAAVTEEMPGVTRDRRRFDAEWNGRRFAVMDTGGWQPPSKKEEAPLAADIREQAESAIAEADLVILVVDAQGAVTSEDAAVAEMLRPVRGRVLVAANKCDNDQTAVGAGVFHQLGLGEPFPVSAIHGAGVADLLDEAVSRMGEEAPPSGGRPPAEPPRVAIIGRPNVGKSTLLNRLAGAERVVVSPVPGTTRDPIDIDIRLAGSPYRLIDTAGMRRRPKIAEDVEFFSVLRARETLRFGGRRPAADRRPGGSDATGSAHRPGSGRLRGRAWWWFSTSGTGQTPNNGSALPPKRGGGWLSPDGLR